MERRIVHGADRVKVERRDGIVDVPRSRVFLIGRLARATNLRMIGREAIDIDPAAVEQAAMRSDSAYGVNAAFAQQLPPLTYVKPLLVMRTAQGELALLDGRQRAHKAFSTGLPSVEAYVVKLDEALDFGVVPLPNEFTLVCDEFLGSPAWTDVMGIMGDLGNRGIDEPIIELLRHRAEQSGRTDLAKRFKTLMTRVEDGRSTLTGHRLLEATRHDPFVHGGERHQSRPIHRLPVELSSEKPIKRLQRSVDAARLDQFFRLFCIELILTEQFMAERITSRSSYFGAIRKRFGGKGRRELAPAGQDYLQQLWREMGLQHAQIDQFHVTLQNAGAILSATGSIFDNLNKYRHALESDLKDLAGRPDNDYEAIRDVHRDKLHLVKVFCKAHIRARQWTSIQHKLTSLEHKFRSPKNEARPLLALANAFHEAHQVDPDLDKTSLDELGLVLVSTMSGVVATQVYPELSKLNTLCEGWAYLYWWKRNKIEAYLNLTPGFLETCVHREAVLASGEIDQASEAWALLLTAFKTVGFDECSFRLLHRQFDRQSLLEPPDHVMHFCVL